MNDLEKDIKTRFEFEDAYSFILRDPAGKGPSPYQKGMQTVFRREELNIDDKIDEGFRQGELNDPTLEYYGTICSFLF